jgi:hypothetical protein
MNIILRIVLLKKVVSKKYLIKTIKYFNIRIMNK